MIQKLKWRCYSHIQPDSLVSLSLHSEREVDCKWKYSVVQKCCSYHWNSRCVPFYLMSMKSSGSHFVHLLCILCSIWSNCRFGSHWQGKKGFPDLQIINLLLNTTKWAVWAVLGCYRDLLVFLQVFVCLAFASSHAPICRYV